MTDLQVFYLPCHTDNAVAAAAPDCRQLPEQARLFVEMQDALDALFADPVMMNDHSLLMLIMSAESADRLASQNKLQAQSGGEWTVAAGAEAEFMTAQLWVRVLPHPNQQAAAGERATLWAAFAREQTGSQEGAWAFALRFCGGDKAACADANFAVRIFAEDKQALLSLRKNCNPGPDDDIALVALEVLKDKAAYALSIVSRYRQGYVPAAHHLEMLVEHSICHFELLKTQDLLAAV